jgi:hypothetical protein
VALIYRHAAQIQDRTIAEALGQQIQGERNLAGSGHAVRKRRKK